MINTAAGYRWVQLVIGNIKYKLHKWTEQCVYLSRISVLKEFNSFKVVFVFLVFFFFLAKYFRFYYEK